MFPLVPIWLARINNTYLNMDAQIISHQHWDGIVSGHVAIDGEGEGCQSTGAPIAIAPCSTRLRASACSDARYSAMWHLSLSLGHGNLLFIRLPSLIFPNKHCNFIHWSLFSLSLSWNHNMVWPKWVNLRSRLSLVSAFLCRSLFFLLMTLYFSLFSLIYV
jgi:hypothetical protein